MSVGLRIKSTINVSKMVTNKLFPKAQEKASISMLDWMVSGSIGSPKKPPIREGILASSGSVFVDGKFLGTTPDITSGGTPTPNKTYSKKGVTWGFNTDYATRMHEDKNLKPGPYSARDPNMSPGNQWLTEHLQKDKNNYTKLIAAFVAKVKK